MLALLISLAIVAPSQAGELAELQARARAVRPGERDLRWQQIPWLVDAALALRTAQAEQRPLFVWLADGRERAGTPLERC